MPYFTVACFKCGVKEDLKLFMLNNKEKNVTCQVYACNKHFRDLQSGNLEVRFYYKKEVPDGKTEG